MSEHLSLVHNYQDLFEYIVVMDNDQIWKLRKVAIGVLQPNVFSDEEIALLEARLITSSKA